MTFKKLDKKNIELEDEGSDTSDFEQMLAGSFVEADKQKAERSKFGGGRSSSPTAGAGAPSFDHKVGDVLEGKVTRVEAFGAFIEIAPGLQGLAHVSELAWTRVKNPADIVKAGQKVSARVLRIDNEGGRLKVGLSLKDAANDPWANLPAQIQNGRVVSGKVTRCMPFGAFVELLPGIEGLIPLSEMSSTKRVSRSDEVVKEGESVSVMVKDVNAGTKRISLSIKDALSDAASASESQDIREYAARNPRGGASESMAAKFQAALDKKNSK